MGKKEAEILDKIVSGYFLPPMSPLAMKLISLASVDNISIEELSSVIEKEPSLATRLLMLANSAFFRTGRHITTIGQAIQLVGLNRLRVMALSLSLRDTFPMGSVGALNYEEFWKISLYQALFAKSFAQRVRTCNPDEAFACGLILEIGLLIFFDLFIKKDHEVNLIHLQPLKLLLRWEEERYGINHRQVGEATLKSWKFPQEIVDCQSHYLMERGAAGVSELALVCNIASEFSALIFEQSMEWQLSFDKAEETYRLDHADLVDILISPFEEVQEIAASLKVEMNREQDLSGLMKKAKRALSVLSKRMINEVDSRHALPAASGLEAHDIQGREPLYAVIRKIRHPLTAVGMFARKLEKMLTPASDEWQYVRAIVEESLKLESALAELERKEKD